MLAADSERDMFDAMMAAGRKMSDPFEIAVNFTVATGAAPDPKSVGTNCGNARVLLENYERDRVGQDVRQVERREVERRQQLLALHARRVAEHLQRAHGRPELELVVQPAADDKSLPVPPPENLAYVTQTTLSLDDTITIVKILNEQFPKILKPKSDDICYATQNRQDAVKQLALESEFIVVIGSRNSSNSNRLKELAEKCGASSILIDGAEELDFESLSKFKSIGVTAGASAPESIVQSVVQAISLELNTVAEELGENKENIYFRLPPELR